MSTVPWQLAIGSSPEGAAIDYVHEPLARPPKFLSLKPSGEKRRRRRKARTAVRSPAGGVGWAPAS